ncbi:MAG: SDR family oxidoreductase [Hyphomicrobiaceae bacterium]
MTEQSTPGTVLITGAAYRIGRAIAERFAANGWNVGVHYRNSRDAAEQIVKQIESNGGRAAAIRADLCDPIQVSRLIPDCAAKLEAPTCLINNASEFHDDTISSLSNDLWDTQFDANLKAPIFLAQAFVEHLPQDRSGNIINIVDQRVWNICPEYFSYTISKSALWTATKMLAQTLAPRIRVNAIGPGPVLQSVYQTEEEFNAEWQKTLLKRAPKLDEITDAAIFILQAHAMTGQMITLDSGQHLT